MRKLTVLILVGVLCCGLALALERATPVLAASAAEQKKPGTVPQTQPTLPPPGTVQARPGIANQQQQGSPEQDKALVRRVFDELLSSGRYEAIEQVYARDCSVHHRGQFYRFEDALAEGKGWKSAAPDLRVIAEQMTVQGNIVTVNWTAQGTHTGPGNGVLKPTGKRVVIHGNSRFRVVNGKIAEVWNDYDRDDIFRQMGVNPKVGRLFDASQAVWLSVSRFFTGTYEIAGLAGTE